MFCCTIKSDVMGDFHLPNGAIVLRFFSEPGGGAEDLDLEEEEEDMVRASR